MFWLEFSLCDASSELNTEPIGLVERQSGALVVAGILNYLTFALCSPYSETTDRKQFDVLLDNSDCSST